MTKRSYKTVLLGDASVGKSSFAVRLTKGDFSENTNSTIGAAFFTYTVHTDSLHSRAKANGHVRLESKEAGTKGEAKTEAAENGLLKSMPPLDSSQVEPERAGSNHESFSARSSSRDNLTIKFDIWDTAGQERFKSIVPIYYRDAACAIVILDVSSPPTLQHAAYWVNQIRVANSKETVIVLVANKVDLLGSSPESVQTLANAKAYAKEHSIAFVETSAKTGHNVAYVFELLSLEISKDPFRWDKPAPTKSTSKSLKVDQSKSSTSKTCCSFL